jgi:hypothetical protein
MPRDGLGMQHMQSNRNETFWHRLIWTLLIKSMCGEKAQGALGLVRITEELFAFKVAAPV